MTEQEAQKLEKIKAKLKVLQAQKKEITTREKKRKQKLEDSRLILIAILTENYFGIQGISSTDYENFLKIFLDSKNMDKCVAYAKEKIKKIKNPLIT
ncbi:MAG: hypothetical protein FWC97_01605 [Treponema sp.]|nr:hypothetical protein [Treponema sp.]